MPNTTTDSRTARQTRVKIELFAAGGCAHCAVAAKRLSNVIARLGSDRFELQTVNVIDEIDHAVALGVLATPAVAINGALVFASLPSAAKLERTLARYLPEHRETKG